MLLTTIQQAVTDRWSSEALNTDRLNRLIAAAVRYYSRYNPYRVEYTFNTVAGTKAYAVPAGCMALLDWDYWPSGGIDGGYAYHGTALELLYHQPHDYDLISERISADIKRSEYAKSVMGDVDLNQGYFELSPVPSTATITVRVIYGKVHALAAGAYATIPDEDLELIRDLTLAELLETAADTYGVEPDYSEGLQRVTKHFIPPIATMRATELRRGVATRYGYPVVSA